MVGKIVTSSSPYSCANYCLNHDGATLLCWEGLDIDPTEAAELARSTGEARLQLASTMAYAIDTSFSIQAETNTAVQKPVGHISLCFMKEDTPLLDSTRMAQIAREYLEMMGYQNTQYMVVRHYNAKGNPHVHIFFNRVDNSGHCLNSWQDFRRNGTACRALTEKYGLHFAQGRSNTIVRDLHGRERARYQISNAIDAALPRCRDLRSLGRELLSQGISMEIHRRNNGSIQGLSFSKSDDTRPSVVHRFRGSEVGRAYSYEKIRKAIECREQLSEGKRESMEDTGRSKGESASRSHGQSLAADIGDILFSSLGSSGTTGYDIDQKPDEKKKRKMGFHR